MTYTYPGDHQLEPPEEPPMIQCWKCQRHLFANLVSASKGACCRCGEEIEPEEEE